MTFNYQRILWFLLSGIKWGGLTMFAGNTQNSRFGPSGDFNRHLYTIQKFIYMCAVLWPSLCIFSDKDGGYQFEPFLGNVRKASRLWFKLKSNGCEFPKHLFACEMGLVYGQKLEIYFVWGTDHGSNIHIMGGIYVIGGIHIIDAVYHRRECISHQWKCIHNARIFGSNMYVT